MEDQIERFVRALDGGPDPPRRLLGLGVALDDAVGDELEELVAGRASARRRVQRALRRLDPPARVRADLLEHPGRRDPVAGRLGRRAASSSRRSSVASEGSRSRARISGRVTVPSRRSVPRALPVRSGGPVTSSTSSSSWKASPISRPKVRSARARVRAGLQAADQAGALEEPGGLQPAPVQVALGRDRDVERVAALGELAEGEAPPRRADSSSTWRSLPSSARARRRPGRRAGRRPRARRSRPEWATTVGRPRRSGAASRTSSWTSVAMWTSSIAVAARIAPSPAPGRRRAGRASGAGACRRPRASPRRPPPAASPPWPLDLRRSRSSTAAMRARQPGVGGVEHQR